MRGCRLTAPLKLTRLFPSESWDPETTARPRFTSWAPACAGEEKAGLGALPEPALIQTCFKLFKQGHELVALLAAEAVQ